MNVDKEKTNKTLNDIVNNYRTVIEDNSILKQNFKSLNTCMIGAMNNNSDAQPVINQCDIIINHLKSELRESENDTQRMQDEAPIYDNDEAISARGQNYWHLRKALEKFRAQYTETK